MWTSTSRIVQSTPPPKPVFLHFSRDVLEVSKKSSLWKKAEKFWEKHEVPEPLIMGRKTGICLSVFRFSISSWVFFKVNFICISFRWALTMGINQKKKMTQCPCGLPFLTANGLWKSLFVQSYMPLPWGPAWTVSLCSSTSFSNWELSGMKPARKSCCLKQSQLMPAMCRSFVWGRAQSGLRGTVDQDSQLEGLFWYSMRGMYIRFSPSERDVHHCLISYPIWPSYRLIWKSTTHPEAFPYKGVALLLDWIGTLIFPNYSPSLAIELIYFLLNYNAGDFLKTLFIWKCGSCEGWGSFFQYRRECLSHFSWFLSFKCPSWTSKGNPGSNALHLLSSPG